MTERDANHCAFLSGGSAHQDLALQSVGDAAQNSPSLSVGLYHIAFEAPDIEAFSREGATLYEGGIVFSCGDYRISQTTSFADPDGNGIEIYSDTRKEAGGSEKWEGQT